MFQTAERLHARFDRRGDLFRGCAGAGEKFRRFHVVGWVWRWFVTEEIVRDVQVGFTTDSDVRKLRVPVSEEVEGKDDGAVGGVFQRDHTEG